jgi:hypothetical protein
VLLRARIPRVAPSTIERSPMTRTRVRFAPATLPLALCALLLLGGARPQPASSGAAAAPASRAISALDAAAAAHARVLDATLRGAATAVAPGVRLGGATGEGAPRPGRTSTRTAAPDAAASAHSRPPDDARTPRDTHAQRTRALPHFHSTAPPPRA